MKIKSRIVAFVLFLMLVIPGCVLGMNAAVAETAEQPMMTDKQRNSINMLNYLTVLVQEINSSSNSRLFLEGAYSELVNNIEPNGVDDLTLDEFENILDIIEGYRMIAIKRERLQYVYDQSSAEAIRAAMPNPIALLSAVQSRGLLQSLVSVAYMAFDAVNSYESYNNALDLQYLQDGWALDDEEAGKLHSSRSSMFSYMVRVSRDLPRGITLNEDAVTAFVQKINDTNVTSRIQWLESNKETYEHYGEYWLVLADSYYEKAQSSGDQYYQKCLDAVSEYEKLDNSIFRKDTRYAQTLPCAIASAQIVLGTDEYTELAARYAQAIMDNTDNAEWSLRYFAAQTFVDLYRTTNNREHLRKAFEIVRDNVNEMVGKQRALNETYVNDVVKEPTDGLSKTEKKQVEQYNKLLKANRKTETMPVYEPLRLNCDLLIGLADELGISDEERKDLDEILHKNDEKLFLNLIVDNMYWFSTRQEPLDPDRAVVSYYDFHRLEVPAAFISDGTSITVTVERGKNILVFDDWKVTEIERFWSDDVFDFTAILKSKDEEDLVYHEGDIVTVTVTNSFSDDIEAQELVFKFEGVAGKVLYVLPSVDFERIYEENS